MDRRQFLIGAGSAVPVGRVLGGTSVGNRADADAAIASERDLRRLATASGEALARSYVLTDDVVVDGRLPAIGSDRDPFHGSLDGDGYTIRGPAVDGRGLVAVLDGGSITDLRVEDVTVAGEYDTGGLVGRSRDGTVRDVALSGRVEGTEHVGGLLGRTAGGRVSDARAAVTVTGEVAVGGLVGTNTARVDDVSASGEVTGEEHVGGLVGANDAGSRHGRIRSASADASVAGDGAVGGLVGTNTGTVADVRASGAVDGSRVTGGLVGANFGTVSGGAAEAAAIDGTTVDPLGGLDRRVDTGRDPTQAALTTILREASVGAAGAATESAGTGTRAAARQQRRQLW